MMNITKRDGRIAKHDPQRIFTACIKAGATKESAQWVVDNVSTYLVEGHHVEHIQDIVEMSLMSFDPAAAKRYILYRDEHNKKRGVEPDADMLSDYILHSKYAKTGESWDSVVHRNCEMHRNKYPVMASKIRDVYEEFVLSKKVLPSMRSLQFAGGGIEKHNSRMYNCSFSHCNRLKFFSECLYLLLSGCGVGFSVQRMHTDQLYPFPKISKSTVVHHVVEDSIEGWADAVFALLDWSVQGVYCEFIYDKIRPEGSSVSSGGKAPGHVPLKVCLESIRDRLVGRLRPIDWHDITCTIAEAVLSGGIRRSSLLSLFDNDDYDMMNAKTGDWYKEHPYRAMANNSAVFLRSGAGASSFYRLFDRTKEFGEPGFFFTNDKDHGTNPCGEIGLDPPKNGFQFCNLTEINGATVTGVDDFIQRAKAAAFIGTLQAGYTDFKYLDPCTKERCERDALLGVSITGVMDCETVRSSTNLFAAANAVTTENIKVASLIGINKAKRRTTIKPSGTASLFLGGVGSGIHPHHSRRYFRRVTANHNEAVFKEFKKVNPHMCEEKPNGDWVICFPVLCSGITQDEISDINFIDLVLNTYKNWIKPGSDGDFTHNISCTVSTDNWDEVADKIWNNRNDVQAISFLPRDDKKYPFMPRQRVATSVEFAAWTALVKNYTPVKYTKGAEDHGEACEGLRCERI